MSDREEFLDIAGAAQFLSVSETSLRRWTNDGTLPCLRVGRKRERRFRRSDLLAFMESGLTAATKTGPAPREGEGHAVVQGMAMPFGSHLCGVYDSEEGRLDIAAGFLAEGTRSGSASFLIARPKDQAPILAAMKKLGPMEEALRRERLVVADYQDTASSQYAWCEAHFIAAMRRGAREIRILGETTAMKKQHGIRKTLEYEAGFDQHIAKRFPVVAICQYDARKLTGSELLGVLKCHHDSFRYPPRRWLA
jgi:transcriptional repressor of dcmA and dcmR